VHEEENHLHKPTTPLIDDGLNVAFQEVLLRLKSYFFYFTLVPIKVDMDVTLQNKTFTEDLKNVSSQKYKNLTAEFIREVKK
jgi:hypothetical protein